MSLKEGPKGGHLVPNSPSGREAEIQNIIAKAEAIRLKRNREPALTAS